MSEEKAKQAATAAKKSAKVSASQAKSALANGTRAVEAVAEEGVDATVETAARVDPKKISRGFGDTGQGFLALAVATYAGALAFTKFRAVLKGTYVNGGVAG